MPNPNYIPYNSSNKDYAKENRKNMTKQEGQVWHTILKQKKTGYKRVRQKMIGSFICDFYCAELLLCVELDGASHDHTHDYDQTREQYMRKKGIKTLRYTNEQVDRSLHAVSRDLYREIQERGEV